VRHGGHRAAAGFTVWNEHLELLRARLVAGRRRRSAGSLRGRLIEVDAEARLGDLNGTEIPRLDAVRAVRAGEPEARCF
jgi:hypothetical protein